MFSEPVEPRFTGLRVTDGEGREVPASAGATDAADGARLGGAAVVAAAGGRLHGRRHGGPCRQRTATARRGSLLHVRGRHPVLRPGTAAGTGPGGLHSGHDIVPAFVEAVGRAAGYLGPMLAFGLVIFALVVLLRPVLPVPVVGRSRAGRYRRGSLEGGRKSRSLGGDPWGMLVTAQAGALLVAGSAGSSSAGRHGGARWVPTSSGSWRGRGRDSSSRATRGRSRRRP